MFFPITESIHAVDPNGIQQIYRFENARGASVVRFLVVTATHKDCGN